MYTHIQYVRLIRTYLGDTRARVLQNAHSACMFLWGKFHMDATSLILTYFALATY